MFMQFNGYNNRPINIQTSVIIGVGAHDKSTDDDPQTVLAVGAGTALEEWIVRESVQSVLAKLNSITQ